MPILYRDLLQKMGQDFLDRQQMLKSSRIKMRERSTVNMVQKLGTIFYSNFQYKMGQVFFEIR